MKNRTGIRMSIGWIYPIGILTSYILLIHYCPVKQKIDLFMKKHPTSRIVKRRFYEIWNSSFSLQCCICEIFISNRKMLNELYLPH